MDRESPETLPPAETPPASDEEVDPNEGLVSSRFLRVLLIIMGHISLGLGVIGIVLPLLPTTPFLLLAAACYSKSSRRLNAWLLHHPWFGRYIRDYREGQGLPLKIKARAILLMWTTILVTLILFIRGLYLRVILILIPSLVTLYLLSLPTPAVEERPEGPHEVKDRKS